MGLAKSQCTPARRCIGRADRDPPPPSSPHPPHSPDSNPTKVAPLPARQALGPAALRAGAALDGLTHPPSSPLPRFLPALDGDMERTQSSLISRDPAPPSSTPALPFSSSESRQSPPLCRAGARPSGPACGVPARTGAALDGLAATLLLPRLPCPSPPPLLFLAPVAAAVPGRRLSYL